jgi:hypothetical protein
MRQISIVGPSPPPQNPSHNANAVPRRESIKPNEDRKIEHENENEMNNKWKR